LINQRERAFDFLRTRGRVSGAELSKELNIPGRSARRYVSQYTEPTVKENTNHIAKTIGQWAVFDIETTALSAIGRQGFMVCCSVLPLTDSKPHTHSIRFGENGGSDQRLLYEVIKDLWQYDFLVGHNINGFDMNWIDTRRKVHGLPPLRRWHLFDTLHVAQSLAWLTERKSLAWLCDALNIECVKTSIYPRAWNEIRSDDKHEFENALQSIVYHCEEDVLSTRRLLEALWPDSFGLSQSPIKRWIRGNNPNYEY
jgi:uncharacterized protein YprB with RNaseH-like and TPR domain